MSEFTVAITGHNVIVDDDGYALVSKYCYSISECSNRTKLYVRRNAKDENGKWVKLSLHRELMGVTDKNVLIDHINGNTLDNRKCNLRLADKRQNRINSRLQSNSTTGCPGVSFHKKSGKYAAYIWIDSVRKHVGLFDNIDDAIQARKKYETDYYGEFAPERKILTVEQLGKIVSDTVERTSFSDGVNFQWYYIAKAIHAALPSTDENDRRIAELEAELQNAAKIVGEYEIGRVRLESKIARAIELLQECYTSPSMFDSIKEAIEILEANHE